MEESETSVGRSREVVKFEVPRRARSHFCIRYDDISHSIIASYSSAMESRHAKWCLSIGLFALPLAGKSEDEEPNRIISIEGMDYLE